MPRRGKREVAVQADISATDFCGEQLAVEGSLSSGYFLRKQTSHRLRTYFGVNEKHAISVDKLEGQQQQTFMERLTTLSTTLLDNDIHVQMK